MLKSPNNKRVVKYVPPVLSLRRYSIRYSTLIHMPYLRAKKSTKMKQKHFIGPESDNYKMLVGKNLIPEIF